jgi:hypothetical protein
MRLHRRDFFLKGTMIPLRTLSKTIVGRAMWKPWPYSIHPYSRTFSVKTTCICWRGWCINPTLLVPDFNSQGICWFHWKDTIRACPTRHGGVWFRVPCRLGWKKKSEQTVASQAVRLACRRTQRLTWGIAEASTDSRVVSLWQSMNPGVRRWWYSGPHQHISHDQESSEEREITGSGDGRVVGPWKNW